MREVGSAGEVEALRLEDEIEVRVEFCLGGETLWVAQNRRKAGEVVSVGVERVSGEAPEYGFLGGG